MPPTLLDVVTVLAVVAPVTIRTCDDDCWR